MSSSQRDIIEQGWNAVLVLVLLAKMNLRVINASHRSVREACEDDCFEDDATRILFCTL